MPMGTKYASFLPAASSAKAIEKANKKMAAAEVTILSESQKFTAGAKDRL